MKFALNHHSFLLPMEKEFSSYLSTWVALLSWGPRLTLRTLRGDKGRAEGRRDENGAEASSGSCPCAASQHPP